MKTYTQLSTESKKEIIKNLISEYEEARQSLNFMKKQIDETHPLFQKNIDARINVYQQMINGLKSIEV